MQNRRKLLAVPNKTTTVRDPVDPNPIGTVAMFWNFKFDILY
jgi:hypothetical protein